jgi:hypothetical protein
MQLKNKLYICLLLSALVLTNSCDKKLDINPTSSLDASVATKDIELTLLGAYALLGSGTVPGFGGDVDAFYGANVIMIPDLLAANDNYLLWSGTFNQYTNIVNHNMINTNGAASETWRRGYQAINTANTVLANLANAETSKRELFEAEAKFIRGVVLFELVRLYAQQWVPGGANEQLGVPVPLTPTTAITEESQIPRSTVAQVYTQVLSDLAFAKDKLPAENDIRANTFVASGYLARVYLQQSEFAKALAEANLVITDGPYELAGSVAEIYNTQSSPSSESIFEIQQTDQNNAGFSNGSLYGFYGCGGSTAGSGRGDINPEDAFIDLYNESDERRISLFYTGTECSKKGRTNTAKWKDPYSNYLVMRLTEMYLIRSECNYRLGSAVGADPLEDLNTIKARANAPLLEEIPSVEDILFERRLELAFEGFAIHDIRRTKGSVGNLPGNSPKLVLPIPLREINVNKALVQNEGYGQ